MEEFVYNENAIRNTVILFIIICILLPFRIISLKKEIAQMTQKTAAATNMAMMTTLHPIFNTATPSPTPIPTSTPSPTETPPPSPSPYEVDLSPYSEEIILLAKVTWKEARGVFSITEQACVMWTVLNRYDNYNGNLSIKEIVTAPHQFAYREDSPTIDDFGRDLKELAKDVLTRWLKEKLGADSIGRVLPKNYFYFYGKNGHNWFYSDYGRRKNIWGYLYESPYLN